MKKIAMLCAVTALSGCAGTTSTPPTIESRAAQSLNCQSDVSIQGFQPGTPTISTGSGTLTWGTTTRANQAACDTYTASRYGGDPTWNVPAQFCNREMNTTNGYMLPYWKTHNAETYPIEVTFQVAVFDPVAGSTGIVDRINGYTVTCVGITPENVEPYSAKSGIPRAALFN